MRKILSICVCLALVLVGGLTFAACGKDKAQTIKVKNEDELVKAFKDAKKGDTIKLTDDVEITKGTLVIEKKLTLDLNGKAITEKLTWNTDTTGDKAKVITLFQIKGGELTVTGNGSITADDLFLFNVGRRVEKVDGTVDTTGEGEYSGKLVIKNGTFTLTAGTKVEGETKDINSAFQCAEGSIEIEGGKFVGETTDIYFLNLIDTSREVASITVSGGEFVGFNPGDNTAEGADTTFVKEGYESTAKTGAENTWVVAKKAN